MKAMAIYKTLFAAASVMLALAACDSTTVPKSPHVRVETVSHAVVFGDNVTKLYPTEQNSLAGFIAPISASAVSYAGLAADDRNARSVERARSVRNYLVAHGYDAKLIHLQPTPSMDARTVVLSVEYAKGVPPAHCPDWSKNSIVDYENTDASDFGCAYNSNFITQLADPNDYNGAHATPVSDGSRESALIQKYLSASSPAASAASSSSGGSTTTTTSSP